MQQRRATRIVIGAVLALLLVLPMALLIRARLGNPLSDQLDGLSLPAAVDLHHVDTGGQSVYCVHQCAWLKRTYQSGQPVEQTDAVFRAALTAHGWQAAEGTCPKQSAGSYSCWQRDQYVLDLWVRTTLLPGLRVPAAAGAVGDQAAGGGRRALGRAVRVHPGQRAVPGVGGQRADGQLGRRGLARPALSPPAVSPPGGAAGDSRGVGVPRVARVSESVTDGTVNALATSEDP